MRGYRILCWAVFSLSTPYFLFAQNLPFKFKRFFLESDLFSNFEKRNTNTMRIFFRFYLLLILLLLLSVSTLPAQDATAKLKGKIMTALERAYVTSAFKIAVTNSGRGVIEGEVPSYWDKQNVFAIVARVPGVKEISNRLSVQTADVASGVIKVELEEYLKRMRAIKDPSKIKVMARASEGEVILGGTVNFPYEKMLAEEIAAWHRGVRAVDNQIEVLSANKNVSDAAIIRIIKNMLNCDFPFEEKTVQVKVEKGRVLLSGAVSRLWAKLEIEKAVQNLGGVRQVENRLEIASE